MHLILQCVLLIIEIIQALVELVIDHRGDLGLPLITMLLELVDNSGGGMGQLFPKVLSLMFNPPNEVSPLGVKLGEFLGWRCLIVLELIHGVGGGLGLDCDGRDVGGGK